MIFIYVLKLDYNKYYTGITKNLYNRLKQHHNKQSGYTSNFNIVSLNYITVADDYKEARKIEVKIKSIGAKKYINKIKFNDRYYIDCKIDNVLHQLKGLSCLNQLKMIINKRVHF